jgi:hypothetical protein
MHLSPSCPHGEDGDANVHEGDRSVINPVAALEQVVEETHKRSTGALRPQPSEVPLPR